MAFGGAFLGGDKRQPELVAYCEALAKRGFCVASIDYRINFNILSTSSSIRAVHRGLQDFRAAVRYFRHHATTYKIAPDYIFGGGNSAGSINAIHAAYLEESDRTLASIFAPTFAGANAPDLGCIDCSGNVFVESGVPTAVVNLWGGIGEILWIDNSEAPITSFHGLDDTTVSPNTASPFGFPIFPPLSGSIPIHAQADLVNISNELHTYPGEGHELWNDSALAIEIEVESSYFLSEILQPMTPELVGDTLVCSDSIYTYSIETPNVSSQYCWEVSNGTVISSSNLSITIQWAIMPSGMLQVIELNAFDAQSEASTIEVSIDPLPIANYNIDYNGATSIFTNTSTGAVEYLWDFGDGTTSTLREPSHVFTINGSYMVELTITNPCGVIDTFTSTVTQSCQPSLIVQDNPTPSGVYQAFNSVSSNHPLVVGSDVFFKARDHVDLLDGFEVNTGDQFEIGMVTCSNN